MILSVLSSFALVSGLMVVRAKNLVHSVLFPIPVFRDTKAIFRFISSIPLVTKLPEGFKICLCCISQVLFLLVLSKGAFALGYVFMDDLGRAVSQFYPSFSGGMSGGSSTPPVPSGDSSQVPISVPDDQPGPSASDRLNNRIEQLRKDPIFEVSYRNRVIKEEEIISITTELVDELGEEIADPEDIRKGVDIYLTEPLTVRELNNITYRNRKLKTILRSLPFLYRRRVKSPFWKLILKDIKGLSS